MQVHVRGRSESQIEAIKGYAEQRVSKLARYFQQEATVDVRESHAHGTYRIEVTLSGDGLILRGKEVNHEWSAALDAVLDKLERQISRYKERRSASVRQAATTKDLSALTEAPSPEDAPLPHIVRTKRFSMKPMGADEAVAQMELLDHEFYLFLNSDSGTFNVIYRREDGNYGLLQPDV